MQVPDAEPNPGLTRAYFRDLGKNAVTDQTEPGILLSGDAGLGKVLREAWN